MCYCLQDPYSRVMVEMVRNVLQQQNMEDACSAFILPVILDISGLLHERRTRDVFMCGSSVHVRALFSAYPSWAFTMHAAADSALLGFMLCALSGQRIPPRNGGIVAADLA